MSANKMEELYQLYQKKILNLPEWRILGFLREVYPLPLTKLRIKSFEADAKVSPA
jgi:hypothetical protein